MEQHLGRHTKALHQQACERLENPSIKDSGLGEEADTAESREGLPLTQHYTVFGTLRSVDHLPPRLQALSRAMSQINQS